MQLLFLAFLPFLLVLFFLMAIVATVMVAFAVGAFLLRVLFFVAIAVLAGAGLLSLGVFRKWRWPSWSGRSGRGRWGAWDSENSGSWNPEGCKRHQLLAHRAPDVRDDNSVNSVFDNYRRATLKRLDDEAQEFRTFLAKLRQAADAADFQAFLDGRRAGRS